MYHKQSFVRMVDLDEQTVIEEYGLEFNDTHIYDPVERKNFKNIREWAVYMDDLQNYDMETFEKISHHSEDDWN